MGTNFNWEKNSSKSKPQKFITHRINTFNYNFTGKELLQVFLKCGLDDKMAADLTLSNKTWEALLSETKSIVLKTTGLKEKAF